MPKTPDPTLILAILVFLLALLSPVVFCAISTDVAIIEVLRFLGAF